MNENLSLIVQLIVCGAICAVSVFLLAVVKKNPKRNERALARRECARAREELIKITNGEARTKNDTRAGAAKALRALNYARRLAQSAAYEDDNAAAGGVLDSVIRARECVADYRKNGGGAEELEQAVLHLTKAESLIDDLADAGRAVRKKVVKR